MKNLLNFFFSFDKLFKEKLIVPFFWLALIFWALYYSAEALNTIALDLLARSIEFVGFFAKVLLVLISIRIVSEIFVAIFRINDNLSPDGGKEELADIDPVAEARKAAEHATARTREMTKTATDKTKRTFDDVRDQVEDTTDSLTAKARAVTHPKAASMTADQKTEAVMGKGSVPKAGDEPTPVKSLEPSAIDAPAVERGRSKGSKNKPTSDVKRGPKKGVPIPRDADGNLLKKDGTPRKKPGPKAK